MARQPGALTRPGLDLQLPTLQFKPFPHPRQTHARGRPVVILKPLPVILHRQADCIAAATQGNPPLLRLSVLGHIRERLLHEAVEADLGPFGQVREFCASVINGQLRMVAEVTAKALHSVVEAHGIEHWGA